MRYLILGALALATACSDPVSPRHSLPTRQLSPFPPDALVQQWWHVAERETGKTKDMNSLRWYLVLGVERFDLGSHVNVPSVYVPDEQAIYLAQYVSGDSAVIHDIALDVLRSAR